MIRTAAHVVYNPRNHRACHVVGPRGTAGRIDVIDAATECEAWLLAVVASALIAWEEHGDCRLQVALRQPKIHDWIRTPDTETGRSAARILREHYTVTFTSQFGQFTPDEESKMLDLTEDVAGCLNDREPRVTLDYMAGIGVRA